MATELTSEALADIVREVTVNHGDAGFGVAVLVDDRAHRYMTGCANPELGITMTNDTLVQIGSTTKLFNAALLLRLVEEGLLDLDTPVSEVIEGFRLADGTATSAPTTKRSPGT